MSITAVITNHNYGRYLVQCIDSALTYCDEVLVYDDGSTDDSLDVLKQYGASIGVTHRHTASGDPIWGSNCGITDATSDYVIFLDADNWLINTIPQLDYDYVFANIASCDDGGNLIETLDFVTFPRTPKECLSRFVTTIGMPYPWGGVWRREFIKDLRWRGWDGTGYAADWRTAVDWCLQAPTIGYSSDSFLSFRNHSGQWSQRTGDSEIKCHDDAVKTAQNLQIWL